MIKRFRMKPLIVRAVQWDGKAEPLSIIRNYLDRAPVIDTINHSIAFSAFMDPVPLGSWLIFTDEENSSQIPSWESDEYFRNNYEEVT